MTPKQRGVLRGIALAAVLTLVAIPGAAIWHPVALVPPDAPGARMAFALKWDILLLLCLLANIGALARHRFFTPEDIDGGGLASGTSKAHVLQCILQNTLEQVVLALPVHLIWAVAMPLDWLASIPVAALLFFSGRVLFWRGYEQGAPARAAGFGLTFYPSVLMLVILVSVLARGMLQ